MNTKRARILIVDDEAVNVKLLQRVLEHGHFENIFSTQDPTQVSQLHKDNNFHLIILDLNMPVLDGFEVLEKLQKEYQKNCPAILVLTAQSQQEHKQRALQMGANDYLTKPFDQIEILARVENMITVQLARELLADQNMALEQQVQKRTAELTKAHKALYDSRLQVVRILGRAAEYRDNETGLHIIRMSQISALIGGYLGMSDDEVEILLHASPMHDIGKIGIPDNILLKPGKFTPKEWKIMQTHTSIGGDILNSGEGDLLDMACVIALSHHEKFDGSGYPLGISGENIPLVGRICALADVFDALTSVRPYKKSWSLNKTISYIKENTGSHFDPSIAKVFLNHLEEMLEIKDQYAEEYDINFSLEYKQNPYFNSN